MKYAYLVIITWLDHSPTQSWTTTQYTKAGKIHKNCPKISHEQYNSNNDNNKKTTTITIIIIIQNNVKNNNKIKWNTNSKTIILIK